jgi:hypothetical protein
MGLIELSRAEPVQSIMGVAIKCILERDVPDIPHMEGKSLALGYCSDAASDGAGDNGNPDIIAVDFRSGQAKTPASGPSAGECVLSPLDAFIRGDGAVEWHDAAKGLAAVRDILMKLQNGATITVTPDFEFADDDEDLTEGVRYDLEELEKILVAAQTARVRFYLAFDV